MPENNIAKQCLQLFREMADKNQSDLMQKINQRCIKYNSSSITLNENNENWLFTSHIIEKCYTSVKINWHEQKIKLLRFFLEKIPEKLVASTW